MLECLKCNGKQKKDCPICGGQGIVSAPETDIILKRCVTTRNGATKLRSSSPLNRASLLGRRIYYVWRLARYVSGQDTCNPKLAYSLLDGDPYARNLSRVATVLGNQYTNKKAD